MRAASVDHEDAIGCAIDPDAIFLLKLSIDTEGELRGISDLENCIWLKKSAGKEETEKCKEPRGQERSDSNPNQPTSSAVDVRVRRARGGKSTGSGSL
jgi:hypothetical protein